MVLPPKKLYFSLSLLFIFVTLKNIFIDEDANMYQIPRVNWKYWIFTKKGNVHMSLRIKMNYGPILREMWTEGKSKEKSW